MAEEEKTKQAKLIINRNIKQAVKELNVASDVPEALNKKVLKMLEEAEQRAKQNGRRTLYARDL